MATTSSVDIGTLITKSPGLYHGRAVLAGTRVPVMIIAGMHEDGLSPVKIAEEKGLSLTQVYAALTYYHANRAEIENDIAEEHAEYDRLEKEWRHAREEDRG